MLNVFRWYAGWLWRRVRGIDALVLWPPLSAPDDPLGLARELYHRYLAHLLSLRVWRLEWYLLALAPIGMWVLVTLIRGSVPDNLVIAAIGILLSLVTMPLFMGWYLGVERTLEERKAALALVRRVCLREIPDGAPSDLADPWRHGWMTADGRPIAAEIAEFDVRSTELVGRTKALFFSMLAFGLVPYGAGEGFPKAILVLSVIAVVKVLRDPQPAMVRARLLDAAAAGTAEGPAWAFAGAGRWAERAETARREQLAEAIRDRSPFLTLGTSLGVLAARGDSFAPSAGLDMGLGLSDLMQHLLVLGGTGSGKTAGVLRPLCKQLGATGGVGLVVIDGKGSLPGEVARFVPDMAVIEPASTAMSLVEGLTPTEIVATISDILGRSGGKDRFFEESAAALMRFAAVLARQKGGASWSLSGIWQLAATGPDEGTLENADLTIPEIEEAVRFFREDWPNVDKEVKSSILATLRAWYTTITGHPDTLKWARTPAGKSDIDITAALKGGRIGILAPAHRYGQAGPVVMALLKARIFAAIRDRADKGMRDGETPVVMVVDEAQDVTTKQDALVLAIARSLKLAVVASTQTVEGIEARLGLQDAAQYLTLFGSVVALQNRSARTAQVVAARVGASFRPVLEMVPGVPTVRSALTAQRASGRLAAAQTQPAVAATIGFGEGGRVRDLVSSFNPFQLRRRTLAGEQEHAWSKVAALPLIDAAELTELTVEPDTALAVLTRARVPWRDVVKLRPEW